MVTSALDGRATTDKFTGHSIEVVLPFPVRVGFEQVDIESQKCSVFLVLLRIPMLFVIFVGPPHSVLTFFGPVKPGPNLLDVFLFASLKWVA